MIKAVFFDFDGVLTMEASGSTSIAKYVSLKSGVDEARFIEEYRKFNKDLLLGKVTHEQIWDDLCDKLNKRIPFQILVDSFINTELDCRIISLVKKIKSNGYKIGMITDNKTDRIKLIADSHKLNELFNVICVSASLGVSKSGKEIFLEALHRAEVSPTEAVFIDNNPENLISPTELGIHTLHFDHDKRDYDKLIKQLICFGVKI